MLRVTFDLGDADLQHFEEVAQQTQALARARPTEEIVAAARAVYEQSQQAQVAGFVRERYSRLKTLLDMAEDPQWSLGEEDRQRLTNALACFSTPSDANATLLDHAIMVELVSRDLHHDLDAYRDFCKFREKRAPKRRTSGNPDPHAWLQQRRDALQTRMHMRRKKDLDAAGSAVKKLFSLFRL